MAVTLTIGGIPYTFIEDTLDLTNSLDERQRFKCDVIDYTGTVHFSKGTQIVLTDPILGMIYSGYLNTDKEVPWYPSGAILHSIDCIDQHYLADKRTYTRTYNTAAPAGKIAVDQAHDVLLAEGLTQNFALRFDTTATDFNAGLLTTTLGRSQVDDGDLELAPAGSDLAIVEQTTADFSTGTLTNMQATGNTLIPTTWNALKMQSTLSFAYGVEFAQSVQTVSGTATGTAAGNASGTVSGSATGSLNETSTGSLNTPVNTSYPFTPSGSVNISGGQPGETASFTGNFVNISPTGNISTGISVSFSDTPSFPFSTSATLPFSTSVSSSYSANVTPTYQPKYKSRVRVSDTNYVVVTVDVAVDDNRVDATIWTGSMVVGTADTLNYDIWIASTSPAEQAGIELYFSDGTSMTEYLGSLDTNTDVGVWDQNRLSVAQTQELSDAAKDCWYTRSIDLSILVGKTITSVSLFNGGNVAGTFTFYVKNCYLGSHSGSPFFSTTATVPAVNPPTVSSIGAYVPSATLVGVVAVYDPAKAQRISPGHSIDAVKLVKDSVITWTAVNPTLGPSAVPGTPGTATVGNQEVIFVSYDGSTWLPCTYNAPLPGLPAGANVSGLSLYLLETFDGGQDPSAIPYLLAVNIAITSAPAATTSDSVTEYGSTAAWNTGTFIGSVSSASGDLMLSTTSYSWSTLNNMVFTGGTHGATTPVPSVSGGAYVITTAAVPSGDDAWSDTRFNFISAAQNFTAEADFTLNGGSSPGQNEIGFLYRQTFWGDPNNSFAYYIRLMQAPTGSVTFGYGINSPPTNGATFGAFTTVQQVNVTITNNVTYHVKLVVGQNRHTVYWNHGTSPIIDILDDTYTQAGNIGVRTYTRVTSGTTSNKIANFSITNTFAGFWTSPSISLSALGTCGNTQIAWSEVSAQGNTQSTAIVLSSLDGGTTWQQCTNGAISPLTVIPGLINGTNVVGKSLIVRVILACSTFLAQPIITGLLIRVCGAYPGSSGTRVTTPLGIDNMSRGNQSGWGTAQDSQSWVKVGTGTDAIASNTATIASTTGDVHEVLGSRSWTDQETVVEVKLSDSSTTAGPELRYVDVNNFYRFAISTSTVSLIKKSAGTTYIQKTQSTALITNTLYLARFRVTGTNPVLLYGKVWLADGNTIEPGVSAGVPLSNFQWTITGSD